MIIIIDRGLSPGPPGGFGTSDRLSIGFFIGFKFKSFYCHCTEYNEIYSFCSSELETSVGGLSTQLTKLEKRVVDAEGRIGATEEKAATHGRAISFLLQQEAELMERCEDLQNRARRQNLRLYQIPEGTEGRDMVAFIKKLLPTVLPSLPLKEDDIRIDQNDPPRSILVGFADYTVKEQILRQAWTQGQVKMGDRQIYFDNDYSPELQRKRAQVRYVIKELKQKNVKAKCLYPARLRMMVGSVEKTFQTLMEAAPALQKMNIQIRVDERDKLQSELTRRRWERQDNAEGKMRTCCRRRTAGFSSLETADRHDEVSLIIQSEMNICE
ncbi:hypothetical protein F7725_024552 [Dissostichus mawsoni]|uniref:L1 transposable element RRM domain-containing protein n=1 Tax=Dissostichus mawsoni TaxID=36200 RepID=A0A7J5Y0I9_DISMA|nr:hypothetical protein F7725_024552 [Dissostichus mawsoni]